MAQVTLTIKLDLPALHKELQEAVNKIKAKLSEVGDVDIDFDLNDLQKDLDKVKSKFKETEESAKGVKGNIREAGLEMLKWIGIAQLVRGAFNFLIDSKNVARDAAEIQSKFDTVFRHLKAEANAWAENFAKSVGRAKSDVKSWMAELQDTFVPLGYTRTKAMELSESLVKLAVDVASFNNASDPEVIRDFTSALVGNHETVRKYGILITENSLKQQAENEGIKKKFDQLTELEKVQLRYNIILNSTTDAQGDAIRTADSLANQEKRQAAELKNMQEELGNKVVPAFLLVTKATMGWIAVLNDLLGVQGPLIDVNQVQATQMQELKSIYDKFPEAFEKYRVSLESDTRLRLANAQATLAMLAGELELARAKSNSLGILGFTYGTGEEEDAVKNQQKVVDTFRVQLETISNFQKNLAEETETVVTTTTTSTTSKIKDMFEQMAEAEKSIMDNLLSDENLWMDQLADIRIAGHAFIHGRIRAMEDDTAQLARNREVKLSQEQKQRLDSLTQAYSQHFGFIVNAAMSSTDKQQSFATQLKNYMVQLLKQYLVQFISTKLAELTTHTTTEGAKTAVTTTGVFTRMALFVLEIGKSLAVAAASIVQAIASGIAYLFATLGPFAIPAIAGLTATALGLFSGIKKTLGFQRGGFTGQGAADEAAGIVHKGEYVFEKSLVDKEPDKYAMLHSLLKSGYKLTDIMLAVKKYTNPIIDAPMALAGVNLGSVTQSRDSDSNNSLNKIQSLLQSMDDRLRKIEEKEFQLKGGLAAEIKLNKKDLTIAVKQGEKELNKVNGNG